MQIKNKIVFPELSYKLVGAAFQVFNELGWGLPEKDCQTTLAKELDRLNIEFKREIYIPIKYKTSNIGRYFADFIVENKILLELKTVSKLGYVHIKQVLTYLKSAVSNHLTT